MDGYWFRPKDYGYGATPVTWQGWAVSAVHAAIVLFCVALVWRYHTATTLITALAIIFVATMVLVYVSWRKTDGAWQWRWGQTKGTSE